MGPEEYTSREELSLIVDMLLAKIAMQAEMIAEIISVLKANKTLTAEDMERLTEHVKTSPKVQAAKDSVERVNNFLTMHNIVQLYQNPPEEQP